MKDVHIAITNDDGIHSPGLRAAVEAVADLGRITIIAPTDQQTATGRGLTGNKQSRLQRLEYPGGHCKASSNNEFATIYAGWRGVEPCHPASPRLPPPGPP